MRVPRLELSNHPGSPSGHEADDQNDNDSRYHAERVQSARDTEDTKTALCLEHDNRGTFPADLSSLPSASHPHHNIQIEGGIAHISVVRPVLADLAEDGILLRIRLIALFHLSQITRRHRRQFVLSVLSLLLLSEHLDNLSLPLCSTNDNNNQPDEEINYKAWSKQEESRRRIRSRLQNPREVKSQQRLIPSWKSRTLGNSAHHQRRQERGELITATRCQSHIDEIYYLRNSYEPMG